MFDGSWKVRARGASNFRNCEFIKEIDWQTTQRIPVFIYITLAEQRLVCVCQEGDNIAFVAIDCKCFSGI